MTEKELSDEIRCEVDGPHGFSPSKNEDGIFRGENMKRLIKAMMKCSEKVSFRKPESASRRPPRLKHPSHFPMPMTRNTAPGHLQRRLSRIQPSERTPAHLADADLSNPFMVSSTLFDGLTTDLRKSRGMNSQDAVQRPFSCNASIPTSYQPLRG